MMTTDSGLSLDQVARSAYAAYVAANDFPEAPAFDELAEETQAFWKRLSEQANVGLESHCEGKTMFEGAQWLASLADKQLTPDTKEALVWEALVRHFWFLLDAGDEEQPESMEGSWRHWVAKKLKRLPTAAQPVEMSDGAEATR